MKLGPDAGTAAVLRRLELTVSRRLDGLLHGEHEGLRPGHGTEPGDVRLYEPGDDVRRLDWAVTARTGEPHVRPAIAETELPASVFHPTHVNRRPELLEEARALSGRGCTVDVTAFPIDPIVDPTQPEDRAIDAASAIASWLSSDLDPTRITCSSDGGGCMPVFDHDGREGDGIREGGLQVAGQADGRHCRQRDRREGEAQ